jgi:hypothetical protein
MICRKDCEKQKNKLLSTGETVCSYCEGWRMECEARHLLGMPLKQRRRELRQRELSRGYAAVERLKERMQLAWTVARQARSRK